MEGGVDEKMKKWTGCKISSILPYCAESECPCVEGERIFVALEDLKPKLKHIRKFFRMSVKNPKSDEEAKLFVKAINALSKLEALLE